MEPEQIRANNAKVAQAKREHADTQRSRDLLATQEIREIRGLLGLTQSEASQVFKGGANAFSKYERGEVIQSEPMDLLLRLARDVPAAAAWLYGRAGLERGEQGDTSTFAAMSNIVGTCSWNYAFAGYMQVGPTPEMPIIAENDDFGFSQEWRVTPRLIAERA